VVTVPLASAGSFPWQRLTREQYDNTIADLMSDSRRLASTSFSSEGIGGSGFPSPGLVSPLDVERLDRVAGDLAAQFSVTCTTDACANTLIEQFTKRAFRRPVSAEELTDFKGLYQWARTDQTLTVSQSVKLVVSAVLQSPAFLYLGEPALSPLPMEDSREPLDGYSLASRLSYFVWGTMPDEALMRAADSDELRSVAQVESQVRRMLSDTKARSSRRRFFGHWLRVNEVPQLNRGAPEFSAARNELLPQLYAFIDDVMERGDGRLETLLTSPKVHAPKLRLRCWGFRRRPWTEWPSMFPIASGSSLNWRC
jgi:hypothetical protein